MIGPDIAMTTGGGGLGVSLGSFRTIYCVWIAVAMLVQLPWHVRWVRAWGDTRGLPRLFDCVRLPRLGWRVFGLLGLALVAGLVFSTRGSGNVTAGVLAVAGVAATVYFPQVIGIPEVRRKPGTVPVILLLLAAAEFAGGSEPIAWVCLITIKVLVAQVYLSSAVMKLRKAGPGWADGTMLRMSLLRYHLRDDSRAALWLARRPGLCRWSSLVVLGFELTFWLMIPFPQLAWIYLPVGIAFHLGTALLMRIHYWIYLFPTYAAFLLAG